MTDLFVSKKITFQDVLFTLDLYKYQMNLYYKNNFRQSSYLGLSLSIILYVSVVVMVAYFLSSGQYSLIQVTEISFLNSFNPYSYPLSFAAYDEDKKEYLSDSDFTIKNAIGSSMGMILYDLKKCTEYEEQFIKIFGKKYSELKKPKGWENFICLEPGFEFNITSTENQKQQINLQLYLIPAQIADMKRNITIKSIFITEYLDDKPSDNNIKLKIDEHDFKVEEYNYYLMNLYFTQNYFKVTGNAFRKGKEKVNFYSLNEIYLYSVYGYFPNPDYDYEKEEGYSQSPYLEKIGEFKFGLFEKRPEYEKKYPSIMDLIGSIGGWLNIIIMIINFIFNFLIPNFIKFDLIKYLMSRDSFDTSKIEKLDTKKPRYSIFLGGGGNNLNNFAFNFRRKVSEQPSENENKNKKISTMRGATEGEMIIQNTEKLKEGRENVSNLGSQVKENNYLLPISTQERDNQIKKLNLVEKKENEVENNKKEIDGYEKIDFKKAFEARKRISIIAKSFFLKDVPISCIYYFIPFSLFINKKKNIKLKYLDLLIESFLSIENIYRMNKELEYALKVSDREEEKKE